MSSKVPAYEKLGAFYLGRAHDVATGETDTAPLLYDSKDLLTHAVCVGMTGSGKTGLCISLIEEAAIDGVPALVVDVKGDLGNLLLNFPDFRPDDFKPWVQPEEAQRKGLSLDEFASQQADLWKNGLAKWDQDGDRLRRLQDAADFAIYTPGSEAGQPISILSSFTAPPAAVLDDREAMQDRIATLVSSLLALLGIDADPIRSREHILLSNLFHTRWSAGEDLDLGGLIQAIQDPPMEKVGVLPLESFYPAKDRFELAMGLNNLLAAPGFQSWMTGVPLDVDQMLYGPDGKPRIAILSIAHLNDSERMFFVSLLLNQVLGWMRSRSGTTSLRALFYMDEVFGYLPPVANPPSKKPILTLLKQARAFGLGLVLATQNPVDLDYKALSNIGTWFLGRLQTERDKERVLDGLESAAPGGFSRKEIEKILSGVGKRVFLLHNVHEEEPVTFYVRWAMSYLCGPLTRHQIRALMNDRAQAVVQAAIPQASAARPASAAKGEVSSRPVLPPGVKQRFLPVAGRPGDDIVYEPRLIGTARVHFVDSRKGIEASEEVVYLAELTDDAGSLDWYTAQAIDFDPSYLENEGLESASFDSLPSSAGEERNYKKWEKAFDDMLYRERRYQLLSSPAFKLIAEPGESERDFRLRLSDAVHERRDLETEKLRQKYARKMETLQNRVQRAEVKVQREEAQAEQQKMQSMVSIGSSILGAFLGRKKFSATNMRRIGSAARSFGRRNKEAQDVAIAESNLAELRNQVVELDEELEHEIYELAARLEGEAEELETKALKPRRSDVDVRLVALAWAPFRDGEAAF